VFDSSTKLPSGILDGNILQMGNYDECLGVQGPSSPATNAPRFTGLYCRVRITELNLPPLSTSLLQQFATDGERPMKLNRTHVLHYMHLPLQHSLIKSQVRVRVSQTLIKLQLCGREMPAP
jgi:Nose resistant-to-fluoxetine protein, N-terminal domain